MARAKLAKPRGVKKVPLGTKTRRVKTPAPQRTWNLQVLTPAQAEKVREMLHMSVREQNAAEAHAITRDTLGIQAAKLQPTPTPPMFQLAESAESLERQVRVMHERLLSLSIDLAGHRGPTPGEKANSEAEGSTIVDRVIIANGASTRHLNDMDDIISFIRSRL